jgi:hypothetical protein
MSILVAALDAGAAARPVLETALRMGRLTGSDVEAVHVDEGAGEVARSLAEGAGVPIRVTAGAVVSALLDVIAAPDVVGAVVGARGVPSGRRPMGHTARRIVEHVDKPVVVVPPDIAGRRTRPIRRLLLPLEGTHESSRPIVERLYSLVDRELEMIVLHVFTPETMPRVLDRPVRDLQLWGDEFGARYGPSGARVDCRVGVVGDEVARVVADEAVDMVALSWSQDVSAGHAEVVRDVVSRSTVPVLLVPVNRGGAPVDR